MLLPLTLLALAGAPLAPPLLQGTAKNGAAVVVVPSASAATSGLAVAAIDLTLPDAMGDDDGAATLPGLAAAGSAVVGKDGRVEVAQRRGHLGVIVMGATPDLVVRALDAVLKAVRAPPPKTPAKTPPKALPVPIVRGAPLTPAITDPDGIAAAWKALAGIGAPHVAVVVVAPGPATDLLRRTQALLTTPLQKNPIPSARSIAIVDVEPSTHLTVPGGNTPATRAALEVVADLVGAHVHGGPGKDDVSVGFLGTTPAIRARLTTLTETPPPQALIDDVARARRLALAAPLTDAATVAEAIAKDLAGGDASATFAVIDALDVTDAPLTSAAVAAAARVLLEVTP